MRLTLAVLIIILSASCKKKPAAEIDVRLVGRWSHYVNENRIQHIGIGSNSRGNLECYTDSGPEYYAQHSKWLLKNDNLYFGWLYVKEDKFYIDSYPKKATNYFIQGLDTVDFDQWYMVLDGNIFFK